VKERYDKVYSSRKFEYRHPGDMLKDDIILDIISAKESCQKCNFSGKKSRLLDVGCGMGHTSMLLSKIVETTGIDMSEVGVKIAEKTVPGKFIVGDVCKIPFESAYFDYVIMKDLLEHVENDTLAIEEVTRVLKKDGIFVLYVPYSFADSISFESLVNKISGYSIDDKVGHLRRYDKSELYKKLGAFSIEDKFYFAHFLFGVISVFGTLFFYSGHKKNKMSGTTPAVSLLLKLIKVMGKAEFTLLRRFKGPGIFIVAKKR